VTQTREDRRTAAGGNGWPAFVGVFRTLLADPNPELKRVLDRLGELTTAA